MLKTPVNTLLEIFLEELDQKIDQLVLLLKVITRLKKVRKPSQLQREGKAKSMKGFTPPNSETKDTRDF